MSKNNPDPMQRANNPDPMQRALRAHQVARDPLEALDAARTLREEAEQLERKAVHTVRAAGTSWSKIGALYGLTKQGAQQRFRTERRDGAPQTEPAKGGDGDPRDGR